MHDKCIRRKCRRTSQVNENNVLKLDHTGNSLNICMAQHEKHYKITWFHKRSVQSHLF